jgi:hypothetical protein
MKVRWTGKKLTALAVVLLVLLYFLNAYSLYWRCLFMSEADSDAIYRLACSLPHTPDSVIDLDAFRGYLPRPNRIYRTGDGLFCEYFSREDATVMDYLARAPLYLAQPKGFTLGILIAPDVDAVEYLPDKINDESSFKRRRKHIAYVCEQSREATQAGEALSLKMQLEKQDGYSEQAERFNVFDASVSAQNASDDRRRSVPVSNLYFTHFRYIFCEVKVDGPLSEPELLKLCFVYGGYLDRIDIPVDVSKFEISEGKCRFRLPQGNQPKSLEFDLGYSRHITSVDLVLCGPRENDFLWGQGEVTPAE